MYDDDVDMRPDAFDDSVDRRRGLNPAEVGTLDPIKTSKKL